MGPETPESLGPSEPKTAAMAPSPAMGNPQAPIPVFSQASSLLFAPCSLCPGAPALQLRLRLGHVLVLVLRHVLALRPCPC